MLILDTVDMQRVGEEHSGQKVMPVGRNAMHEYVELEIL